MITKLYLKEIENILERIENTQSEKIQELAKRLAATIDNNGIIYLFGCGHSHLIALDCFYRAGGLANVSAMLDCDLMLHNGAAKSSKLEKMTGIANEVFRRYGITQKDFLIILSTSGKNAVPVEMAKCAKIAGIPNAAIVSSAYFTDKPQEDMLYANTDLYLDNCVPHGDAVMDIPSAEVKMGSVSTAASSFLLQSVLLEAANLAKKPPVYMSGNVDGGTEFNDRLVARYLPRIKHL